MTKIQRQDFVAQNTGKAIDIGKVRDNQEAQGKLAQAGVSLERLQAADIDRDGKVDSSEAWKLADHFDRDGNAATLIAATPTASGAATPTQAGKSATVLGLLLQDQTLQPSAGSTSPTTATTPSAPKGNDEILFVGMNNATKTSAGAKHEITALQKTGAKLTTITDAKTGDDTIKVGSRIYDLTQAEGRQGFAGTLGLPQAQASKIADVLEKTGADARDEVAQIAQVWAKGEKGGSIPSRLLLSGHHVGSGVWGDDNGKISWDVLRDLASAMPRAAAQVEDLHLSACYSGGKAKHEMYQEIFPNAKTIWAYSGSAPGSGSGATTHQAAWEKATRGGGTAIDTVAAQLLGRGIRKAENLDVAVVGKTLAPSEQSFEQQYQRVRAGEATFERFFQGTENVANSQSGPLREYYNNLQALLQQPALSPRERLDLENRRDQTIRTLFYDSHIRHRFEDTYKGAIEGGYRSLGLTAPDYGSLSRQGAREAIETYRDHLSGLRTVPQEARDLLYVLNGLWNLDSQTVPETWI